MNLGEMRTLVRRDLHDEDSSAYRWANDELDRHIARALKEFSEYLPNELKATIATTSGSREISLSSLASRVMVEAIEYPVDRFPSVYPRFNLWGDTLTLLGNETPDGSNAYVYYGKLHSLDAASSTIPARHEDLVAAGAAAYAAIEWAVYSVNRVNTGGAASPRDFLNWGNERLGYFKQELKRLGRRHRVRVRALYKPYYPVTSKTTDYGP